MSSRDTECKQILDAVYAERPGIETFRDRRGHAWFSVIRYPERDVWDSHEMLKVLYTFLQVVTTACGVALDWRAHRFMDWAVTLVESAQQDEQLLVNKSFRRRVEAVCDMLVKAEDQAAFSRVAMRLAMLLEAVEEDVCDE